MLWDADNLTPFSRVSKSETPTKGSGLSANHPLATHTRAGVGLPDASGSGSFSSTKGTARGGSKAAQSAATAAPGGAADRAGNRPLGNNLKSVDSHERETQRLLARRELYADLRTAGLTLRNATPPGQNPPAVAKCRWCQVSAFVELRLTETEGGRRAAYRGVKVCGNLWGCPVCGSRISQMRRAEMNTLLVWARSQGLIPVMLTLTARHGLEDRLADLLDAMKNAKRRLRQRAEWRRLPVAGTVSATEMTHGRFFGWHPHFHEIVLLEAADEEEALNMVQPLADAWRASLRAFGLDGNAAAFDAQGAAAAGDYVAKWGAAEELTLTGVKRGRGGRGGPGRSPRELLRLVAAGDDEARLLWLEYFAATSGKRRRQLVWSPGLKARCGLDEVSDEEAAEAETATEIETVAEWDGPGWRRVRSKRVRLMEAAERGGAAAVEAAERGPDDAISEGDDFAILDTEADGTPAPPRRAIESGQDSGGSKMSGIGIAVSRKYQVGLERCGYKCSELLPEQSNLSPDVAAQVVYVHTSGEEDMQRAMKLVGIFKQAEESGVPIDGLLSAATHYGVLSAPASEIAAEKEAAAEVAADRFAHGDPSA